jgi:hydroxymethylpyrimidine/phosphomethylpyrimidine kinase
LAPVSSIARQHAKISMDLNQVTIPCKDYAESVSFYARLGLRQIVDSPPRYARFETKSGTTLSIHDAKPIRTESEVVIYFEVEDVDATVKSLKKSGLKFESDPTDQSWLWREAYLKDPAGNVVCIYHAGQNRRYPPWRISANAV